MADSFTFQPTPGDVVGLNLGCGEYRVTWRPKVTRWINVDRRKTVITDLECDCGSIPLPDGCADVIVAVHVLEHLPRPAIDKTLVEWQRLLKPGGTIDVEVPNFDQTVRDYLAGNLERIENIYGRQRWDGDAHFFGYNAERLSAVLTKAGFVDLTEATALSYHIAEEPCLRVVGRKPTGAPSPAKPPFISVILPVHNGVRTIDRALRSVIRQTFSDWEVVAVDDGSTDETYETLQWWAREEPRIRVCRLEENRGVAAARNFALQHARGEFVVYLDDHDEFYADYLDQVQRHCAKADVLILGYDFAQVDGQARDRPQSFDPSAMRQHLFARSVIGTVGVVHRRALWEKAGGFNELLWRASDWDFWKRLARGGEAFAFLPLKSGVRHVPAEKRSSETRITSKQRTVFEANWRAAKPIYGEPGPRRRPVKKIAFASPHCLVDFTSGAAIATLEMLKILAKQGFECQAFCGTRMDAPQEMLLQEVLANQGADYQVRRSRIGNSDARLIFTIQDRVPVTVFENQSTGGGWANVAEAEAFLTALGLFLDKNRPDVVLTYGGDPVSQHVVQAAKYYDIPVVFCLKNFGYHQPEVFASVDYAFVPSVFSQQHYWQYLGLACQVLPNVIPPERVVAPDRRPECVTFVNPSPEKGVFVFARIAEQLQRRRPDIPILVVEGRGQSGALRQTGVDLSWATNLQAMPNTPDPRKFYQRTKLLLMPSLWNEAFGLVAAEAMLNGIPVLGSNRGALPETIGDGGFLFEIPDRYTPETVDVTTAEEVEPWVEAVIQLWDEPTFYDRWSRAARERSQLWQPQNVAPIYKEFFANVFPQPGPPLVPRSLQKDANSATERRIL